MKPFLPILIAGLTLASSPLVIAQDADTLMKDCVVKVNEGNWQEALAIVNKVVADYGKTGVKKIGAKYGIAYYYQGFCQLKIAQEARRGGNAEEANTRYQQAIEAFEQCYAVKNTEADIEKGNFNLYQAKSLMLRGNAEQAMDDFQQAIESYNKFLLESNFRDSYDFADLSINLAICHWMMDDSEENHTKAEEHYQNALKVLFRPPSTKSKMTGLRVMMQTYLKLGKVDQLEKFVSDHKEYFRVPLFEATEALPYLGKISIEAAQSGLYQTVKVLNEAVPSEVFTAMTEYKADNLAYIEDEYLGEEQVLHGIDLDLLDLPRWKSDVASVKVAITEAEELAVCSRAILYEREGYISGALKGYEGLLEYGEKTSEASYLYNAARLALTMGDIDKSYQYGYQYIEQYPEEPLHQALQQSLMLACYYSGEYEKCALLGKNAPKVSEADGGEASLDWYYFTMGGASYYNGDFAEAEEHLITLRENYPDSEYLKITHYLFAAAITKQNEWEKGITLLDDYIASEPEQKTYIPFAHYDKAYAYYSMQDYPKAIKALEIFNNDFSESVIKPEAHILLGKIHLLQRDREKAEAEYRLAITSAKEVENSKALDEGYYHLISLIGQRTWDGLTNKRLLDAVPEYEAFIQLPNAKQSPYFTQIVTASFEALSRAERKEEAYEKLREVILAENIEPNTPGVEAAVNTYTIAKRRAGVSDEEVMASLRTSKEVKNIPYHAGLLIGIELSVLELSQRLEAKPYREEAIQKLFYHLHVEHDSEVLDNFVLIKLAEFMKVHGGLEAITHAKKYYHEILNSGSKIKLSRAIAGLAVELAKSDNEAERIAAINQFSSIVKDPFTQPIPKARAHYQLIEILFAQEKHEDLITEILAYLKYPSAAKEDIRRVEMLLATGYDRLDRKDDAIGAYNAVWVNSFEDLDQSAPAINRITELIWERNQPAKEFVQEGKSDKQVAYETCLKYIRRTEKIYKKKRPELTNAGIDAWEAIREKVLEYEKDAEVKPL